MAVLVLRTNCYVSLKPTRGPVTAQTTTVAAASKKSRGPSRDAGVTTARGETISSGLHV